jgi:ribosomal protein L12E/L44/L45/RPP1/RPP2
MSNAQQAAVLAAFILDGGDSASIIKVAKAANIDVPPAVADALGKTFATQKLATLVKNVSVGGGAAAGAAPAAAAKKDDKKADEKKPEPKKAEEKKPAPKPADDDDDLFGGGLF